MDRWIDVLFFYFDMVKVERPSKCPKDGAKLLKQYEVMTSKELAEIYHTSPETVRTWV